MVPAQVFLLPQYLIMVKLDWLNTLQAVIVPKLFSAFGTFLLRQFFMGVPKELEEAARLDGCNHFQIYWYVMLPLAKPGLIALGIFTTFWSWNELMWPMIVNNSPDDDIISWLIFTTRAICNKLSCTNGGIIFSDFTNVVIVYFFTKTIY